MNLLVCTQKVDKNDDVLGFMHGWIVEFAKNFDNLVVICLQEGQHNLPENVKVLSLGKPASRLRYIKNFYKYIWQERKNYDTVFVHMNPEYVILGGPFFKLWGKKVTLWYNHLKGGLKPLLASIFSDIIFYTSTFAFAKRFKQSEIMSAGIDTTIFRREASSSRETNSILSLGRISPVKKIDVMISAAKELNSRGLNFSLHIYGDAPDRDKDYFEKIKLDAKELMTMGRVDFHPGVANLETPGLYNKYEIFVNATQSGSLDKTILEAMACGEIPLVSNRSFVGIIPESCIFKEYDSLDLANKAAAIINMSQDKKKSIISSCVSYVENNHSLKKLVSDLRSSFESLEND